MELQYAEKFAVDYYEGDYALITIDRTATSFWWCRREKKRRKGWTKISPCSSSHWRISIWWRLLRMDHVPCLGWHLDSISVSRNQGGRLVYR